MAVDNKGFDYTIVAGADLSACQYTAIAWNGALAATGLTFAGVIYNKPQSGEHVSARMVGMTKFRAGGAVAAGEFISATTSGFMVKVSSGGMSVGQCYIGVASGYLGTALLGKTLVGSY